MWRQYIVKVLRWKYICNAKADTSASKFLMLVHTVHTHVVIAAPDNLLRILIQVRISAGDTYIADKQEVGVDLALEEDHRARDSRRK